MRTSLFSKSYLISKYFKGTIRYHKKLCTLSYKLGCILHKYQGTVIITHHFILTLAVLAEKDFLSPNLLFSLFKKVISLFKKGFLSIKKRLSHREKGYLKMKKRFS